MTTSESKDRFFLQNEYIRIDSHNESNRFDLNRELECSSAQCWLQSIASHVADSVMYVCAWHTDVLCKNG